MFIITIQTSIKVGIIEIPQMNWNETMTITETSMLMMVIYSYELLSTSVQLVGDTPFLTLPAVIFGLPCLVRINLY